MIKKKENMICKKSRKMMNSAAARIVFIFLTFISFSLTGLAYVFNYELVYSLALKKLRLGLSCASISIAKPFGLPENFKNFRIFMPLPNECFRGVYWNQPVCLSVHVSVCVQNTSLYHSAGIKSHLVTAVVTFGEVL